MKYTLFYDKIKNSLDDQEVINQLIDAYTEPKSFYSALTNRYSKDKERKLNLSDCDELYASLFNRWKKELFLITRNQYELAIKNGLYDKSIYKLLNFLKTVPDVKTKKEADAILDGEYKDKELENAIEKYRWDCIGAYSGWTHISERHINGRKTILPEIEHRLYINADLKDIHKLSKVFMDKCHKNNLQFYFKIEEYEIRDDSMVIYTDTKLLPYYLSILGEIEKEYPDIIKRCGHPPILSGVIRNWIGYGSEPIELSGEESFNSIRAKSIEKAIKDELIAWYRNNKESTIKLKDKTLTLTDYLARLATKSKIQKMIDQYNKYPNSKYIKYTEEEINCSEFIGRTYKLIKEQIDTIFNDYINEKTSYTKIEIPIKEDVSTLLYASDIIEEFNKFIKVIRKNDSEIVNRIRNRIKMDAVNIGVDPNKYCFDIDNVELLRKAELESQRKSTATNKTRPINEKKTQTSTYRAMTDEEILQSRRKLFESQPVKVKK